MNKSIGVTFLVVITLFLIIFNTISLTAYFNRDKTITGKSVSSDDSSSQQAVTPNNAKNTTPKVNVTSSVKSTSSKSPSPAKNTPTNKTNVTSTNLTQNKSNITVPPTIPPQSPQQPTQPTKSGLIMFADDYSGSDEEFSISINIDSNTSIISLNYELSFNNSIVEVKSLVGGDYLSRQGDSFPYDVINNTAGKVSHFETIYGEGKAIGKGTIGIVTFKKKQPGKFILQFTKSQVILPNIEMLNATSKNSTIELV